VLTPKIGVVSYWNKDPFSKALLKLGFAFSASKARSRLVKLTTGTNIGNGGVIVIEAGRLERNYWLDLWRYRELFRVLAWRDLVARYKQTAIGVAWALISPLLTMAGLTVISSPNYHRREAHPTRCWSLPACCRVIFSQPAAGSVTAPHRYPRASFNLLSPLSQKP
jgi:hypothetical protein